MECGCKMEKESGEMCLINRGSFNEEFKTFSVSMLRDLNCGLNSSVHWFSLWVEASLNDNNDNSEFQTVVTATPNHPLSFPKLLGNSQIFNHRKSIENYYYLHPFQTFNTLSQFFFFIVLKQLCLRIKCKSF